MNARDYSNIRHAVYSAVYITPDRDGWLVTGIKFDRIISAAQGDFRAITATLDRMTRNGELADILPALVDWSHEAARTAA
jgi:hypothetical protein